MRALLLAAGLGTRLRPATDRLPKPAIPFLNVPLLYWSFDVLRELKPDRVIVNLHHLPDALRPLAKRIEDKGTPVVFSHEVEKPLGGGGALWQAREHFKGAGTVLIANGDEVTFPVNDTALTRMHEAHKRSGAFATMLVMEHPGVGTQFGGVWVDESMKVFGFGKDRALFPNATKGLHWPGLMMIDESVFQYIPEGESNILYDVVTAAIAKGETVRAFCEPLTWFETGNPKDFLHATKEALALASPMTEPSNATAIVQRVLHEWSSGAMRFWESNSGARMLSSDLAPGSLTHTELCAALEARGGFAVIGSGAHIAAPVINSVVLNKARVTDATRDQIIVS